MKSCGQTNQSVCTVQWFDLHEERIREKEMTEKMKPYRLPPLMYPQFPIWYTYVSEILITHRLEIGCLFSYSLQLLQLICTWGYSV